MKRIILPLGLVWLALSLAACEHSGTGPRSETIRDAAATRTPPAGTSAATAPSAAAPSSSTPQPAAPSAAVPSPAAPTPGPAPSPSPAASSAGERAANASPSPSPTAADSEKEDTSIRAVGTLADGRLLVKPASKATVAPLGAPSCLGQETDLNWRGDYVAVWESKSKAASASTKVLTFPAGFDIIQPNETPVAMRHFTLEGTDMFAYTPRYTDCHGLETYLFGVSGDGAFPIPLELKPDTILTNMDELPHRPFQVKNGEIMWTAHTLRGKTTSTYITSSTTPGRGEWCCKARTK